jgi:hypothetical protein
VCERQQTDDLTEHDSHDKKDNDDEDDDDYDDHHRNNSFQFISL